MVRLSLGFLASTRNEFEVIEMAVRLRMSTVYCALLCTLFCGFLRAGERDSGWSYAKETPEQHASKMQWWNTALQPGIITNDRLGEAHLGDHKTFERRIPQQAPVGVDWEVCMPISGSWDYKKSDTKFKSTETLIRNLADIASKGGNYLLNVSPAGMGILLPQATERLKAIGQWMKLNCESIYGTTASPFGRLEWGRCTNKEFARGATLYLPINLRQIELKLQ